MGRKVFQDFAHVMCQKFIESPASNRDLVNLAVLGNGRLELNILSGKATHNGVTIKPLAFSASWLAWVKERMAVSEIPESLLKSAALTVEYEVELSRKTGPGWLSGQFKFACTSLVEAPDRSYTATMNAEKIWGLCGEAM
jgi:hypothetical protein